MTDLNHDGADVVSPYPEGDDTVIEAALRPKRLSSLRLKHRRQTSRHQQRKSRLLSLRLQRHALRQFSRRQSLR